MGRDSSSSTLPSIYHHCSHHPFNGWLLMLLLLSVVGVATSGCSYRPARVKGVDLDADHVCDLILADLDTDQDGLLEGKEMKAEPALASLLGQYDNDQDGSITRSELTTNLERVFDPKYGLVSVLCRVTRQGRPLAGANVRFVPVSFLSDLVPVAEGVTNSNGGVALSIDPDNLPAEAPPVSGLVRPGMYLVQVTHPTIDIPNRYNEQTQLAREISRVTIAGPMMLELRF